MSRAGVSAGPAPLGAARACLSAAALVLATVVLASVCAPAEAAFPGLSGKIAFTTSRDGDYEVYAMGSDGSAQTNLTANAAGDLFPAWSPDGKHVAFASFRDAGNEEIYVMDADGSNQTRLTTSPGADAAPSWSPDGTRIAFRSDRDGGNFEIYVMNADGTNQTNVTNDPATDDAPAWSPGGSKIAFETNRNGDFEVYSMYTNGTNPVDLSSTPAGDDQRPVWSPYGQKIAFSSSRDGNDEIYSMNANGSGQTRLTTNTSTDNEPAWSPDGLKIAFRSQRDGNAEIYSMNADGSVQTRLTSNTAYESHPDWQPTANGYPRSKSATPIRAALVLDYQACTSPNKSHGSPLSFGSCSPPVQASPNLTVGTADANGATANFVGALRLTTIIGNPSDVSVVANMSDVRCKAGVATCAGGALSDYTGQLEFTTQMRITDKLNGSSGVDPATGTDLPFAFAFACTPTTGSEGSSCDLNTSANALTPGAVKTGARETMQFGQLQVTDGGMDGIVSTQDNSVFAVQGYFVP
jgi:TolB protein